MKKIFIPLIMCASSSLCTLNGMIQPDTLLLKQEITHGAPIQSVAWYCNFGNLMGNFAAIGGYHGIDEKLVRLYKFENEKLTETFSLPGNDLSNNTSSSGTPESFVYSVDFTSCPCNNTTCDIQLAVGGADKKVHQYQVNSNNKLDYINSFNHGGTIYAVKWLKNCCTNCEECAAN